MGLLQYRLPVFVEETKMFRLAVRKLSTSTKKKGSFLLQASGEVSDAAVFFPNSQSKGNDSLGRKLISQRDKQMGPNVSVFYKQDGGLVITRGDACYLIDSDGNKYLDCANNVAHVGHSHPRVVKAGCDELGRVQTNSRFLNPIQQEYLGKLLQTFPKELNTVYMVNSGSEANELALRIARAHTKAACPRDVICLDYAYHGHTQALVDISPYKWAQAVNNVNYQPPSTHVVSCPDTYRGAYRGYNEESGRLYAAEIENVISKTGGVGAFIAESIVGCGGQIMLPPTYLERVYKAVRNAGGVCIADEVQTGFGRAGSHFWTFEEYGVVPDIVTVGKPMGNGYPVAGVVCRREVAESFASSGIEYFNTYGGNSVACSIANAVIDTIKDENLQQHAYEIGVYLKENLEPLKKEFKWVGDVRGLGLFQGVEFVRDNSVSNLEAHSPLTKFVVDYLRFENIIISRDGPDENVIKIKPPMVFGQVEADKLIKGIRDALLAAQKLGKF